MECLPFDKEQNLTGKENGRVFLPNKKMHINRNNFFLCYSFDNFGYQLQLH